MDKIIYKELSYLINGLIFKTHKELGRYKNEKQYGDCFEKLLKEQNINYKREYRFTDTDHGEIGSRCVLDFLIEDKVVVEFKTKDIVTKDDYFQIQRYLKTLHLKLAILANFRQKVVYPKRIVNTNQPTNNR